MGKLIKAEFLKLSKSRGYKILLLCAVGIAVLVGLLLMDTEVGMPDGYSAYCSGLTEAMMFLIFAMIFAGVFICSEFSNRTFGMSLFSGCHRRSILLSKAIVFFVGFLPIVFAEPLIICAMVSCSKGFGDANVWSWAELIRITLLFILGCAAMCGFSVMLAVFTKNIGGTIGAGLGIMLGLDLLGMIPKTKNVTKLWFLYQMKSLPELESIGMFITIILVTVTLALGASVLTFRKSELK